MITKKWKWGINQRISPLHRTFPSITLSKTLLQEAAQWVALKHVRQHQETNQEGRAGGSRFTRATHRAEHDNDTPSRSGPQSCCCLHGVWGRTIRLPSLRELSKVHREADALSLLDSHHPCQCLTANLASGFDLKCGQVPHFFPRALCLRLLSPGQAENSAVPQDQPGTAPAPKCSLCTPSRALSMASAQAWLIPAGTGSVWHLWLVQGLL